MNNNSKYKTWVYWWIGINFFIYLIATIITLIQVASLTSIEIIGLTGTGINSMIFIVGAIPIVVNIFGIIGSLLLGGGNNKGVGFIVSGLIIYGLMYVFNINIVGIIVIIIKAILWTMAINNIKKSEEKAGRENLKVEDIFDLNYVGNIVDDNEKKEKKIKKDYLETIVKKGESIEEESFLEKVRSIDLKGDINKIIKKLIIVGIFISTIWGMVVFNIITNDRYMRMSDKRIVLIVVISIIYFIGVFLFVNKSKLGPYLILVSTIALIFTNQKNTILIIIGILALLVWLVATLKSYKYMNWINFVEGEKTNYNTDIIDKIIKVILCITILISIAIILYYINLYRKSLGIRFYKKYFVLYGLGISMYIMAAIIFIRTRFNKFSIFVGSGILSMIMFGGVYYRRIFRYRISYSGVNILTVHCKIMKVFYLVLFLWGLIILLDLIKTVLKNNFAEDVPRYI